MKNERNIIEVKDLNYNYITYQKEGGILGSIKSLFRQKKEVVNAVLNISFEIKEGEIIGLLGPNGAGKSTIIKCLTGILMPKSGDINVDGFLPFKKEKKFLKEIGVVFGQKSQLIWDLPAIDTFLMLKEIYEINDEKFNNHLKKLVGLLNLDSKLKIPVRKLSLGERMKFEMICSLIHMPKILFLDEPTIGIDIISQKAIYNFLKEYNKENNVTIILTSHYINDIKILCDRVIIIKKGEKIFDIETLELLKKYTFFSKIIVEFLQDENINITENENIKKMADNKYEISLINKDDLETIFRKNGIKLESIYSINHIQLDLEDILYDIFSD